MVYEAYKRVYARGLVSESKKANMTEKTTDGYLSDIVVVGNLMEDFFQCI